MKKIFIYGLLAGAGLLNSCSSDFLEKEPPLYFSESEVWSTAEGIAGNVNSLYGGLKSQYALGGKIWVISDNIGEDFVNVSGNGYELDNTYNARVSQATQENYETWRYVYLAINRANVFLKNLEDNKDVAGSKAAQYEAEAKFVRALGYFYLHVFYTMPYVIDPNAKSVVLRLQAETEFANNDLARSSSTEVLNQIMKDLEGASALPSGSGSTEFVTHATQGAAEALKQRVYLVRGEWDNAIASGEKIKSMGYSLADDVASVFTSPYITTENIFSLPFDQTNYPGGQYAVPYYYIGGRSDEIDAETGIVSKKGYGELTDARIAKLTNIPEGGRFLTKYTNNPYTDWLPIFRYAETLLNMAEAYANKGDNAKAIDCLKQVRSRSLSSSNDPLNIDGLTGDALKTAIYNERRLEFLGEGLRALDIFRRGETIVKRLGIADEEWSIEPSKGTTGYIWPIPSNERAQNHAIED
jgi:tetratricopeptide (TPR) repeat protein